MTTNNKLTEAERSFISTIKYAIIDAEEHNEAFYATRIQTKGLLSIIDKLIGSSIDESLRDTPQPVKNYPYRLSPQGNKKFRCPNCGEYHLMWGTRRCKLCNQKLKWNEV